MSSPSDNSRRRVDAYFTASFEVARRLADGRGQEAIDVLRRELDRLGEEADPVGRRFLLSQVAMCHARMDHPERVRETLEEMEEALPGDAETGLMLAEGYLHLLGNSERASHHAALALQWSEENGDETPETLSRAQTLMARALIAGGDRTGAFGAWQAAPLPDWKVAVDLIEAGVDPLKVREVLHDSVPRHEAFELSDQGSASAVTDQIRRLISWIDAGCPRTPSPSS
jgi:hypothetical protein